jgi:hypothetical protein
LSVRVHDLADEPLVFADIAVGQFRLRFFRLLRDIVVRRPVRHWDRFALGVEPAEQAPPRRRFVFPVAPVEHAAVKAVDINAAIFGLSSRPREPLVIAQVGTGL